MAGIIDGAYDLLYSATTGNVSPGALQDIKNAGDADIARASAGADPSIIAYRQNQNNQLIDHTLQAIDAHPSQSTGLRLPGNLGILTPSKVVIGGVILLGVVGVIYFLPTVLSRR